ncbi:hypothetical protein TIFTF001_029292 [Ficus carica]|uniref:Uncharacterized protein n=1 Tax=Ficus carica TaxID=3494 RepID=A0AA88DRI6_FICCA|nr:hypothetical protein TIFTF001_029292 [Ficus carica]
MIIVWFGDQRNHRGRLEVRSNTSHDDFPVISGNFLSIYALIFLPIYGILLATCCLGRRFAIVDGNSTTSTTMASRSSWSSGEVAIARRTTILICATLQSAGCFGQGKFQRHRCHSASMATDVGSLDGTDADADTRVSNLGELGASGFNVCERLWGFCLRGLF